MTSAFEQVLETYEARRTKEAAFIKTLPREEWPKHRDSTLLAIGPSTGRLLYDLITGLELRSVLEIGTSYGYSTLWFAHALRQTNGRLITTELADYKLAHAREQLKAAGLDDVVDFREGDALEIIPTLDGPFDLVFVDLWKDLYIPSAEQFLPKLAPGALIIADNMLKPEWSVPQSQAYSAWIRSQPGIESIQIPFDSGLEISRFKSDEAAG
ncbi:class I SAM-dependent methyltransferase [Tsuneonella sp. CC-YZS046]|uniref:O-methyltransferase n=1 Tax=Tsuneonella sp. CC-YZS046 TaxID=3042152 RepID=UPI002D772960|nr:class I SAM-dependent methyltransferase [Tsuneonella sp. CC-YZS046]WRO66622.1 class I SAM-dependent methyltransferase [Tsuneonella sp. CC-YZS046]